MGILESYVLDEIDNDVEYVATQVGELMRRNKKCTQIVGCTFYFNAFILIRNIPRYHHQNHPML